MEEESDIQRERSRHIQQQADFTLTVQFLHEVVSLTNLIEPGPTFLDEGNWPTQAFKQWKRTLDALKGVFCHRYIHASLTYTDAEFDDIPTESLMQMANFGRDQQSVLACRVGSTIKKYASMLKLDLDVFHSWTDAHVFSCSCCQSPVLQGLQQATMHQLTVLENVAIPWTSMAQEQSV